MGFLTRLALLGVLRRLHLVKTTGWQHRFLDLTILSPICLGTYDYKQSPIIRNGAEDSALNFEEN